MYSKNNISRKGRTSYNLEWRVYASEETKMQMTDFFNRKQTTESLQGCIHKFLETISWYPNTVNS